VKGKLGAWGLSHAWLALTSRIGASMTINIDHLTEAELIDLNRRIVERLRLMQQVRAHVQMLEFKIGDRVSFQPAGRPTVVGILTKYNRKTVTIITNQGEQWNVAPTLLSRVEDPQGKETVVTRVIQPEKK
jgi:hypothetical protein